MLRLDARTALVTGGTRGMGAAIAALFTGAGAKVMVAGVTEAWRNARMLECPLSARRRPLPAAR